MNKEMTWFTIGRVLCIEIISGGDAECNIREVFIKVRHLGGHEQMYLYTGGSILKATNNDVISFFFVAGEDDYSYKILEII
ncbi:hypothetical protein LU604_21245 [Erwinia tracheiphila]|uniref:Uncharacterized protein n=1 Tax=Erwinia tracheiphila TaxID=65700 RepID=A0A345CY44_9GAMM|nr:hypothetical protein [Erwinia tracheiphila]AXF78361.1 hypothetical protein AV903_23900 [Erwinia tracheiphila]UIA82908.1 hypothetical protein LU604_21245 [Erwinia tracheiphila]